VKFNKSTKETKYIKNHCDMLHRLALNLASLIRCTVSPDTLVGYIFPTSKPQCQIMLKAFICSKQTATSSYEMSGSEDTCCPLSLWCL